MRTALAAALFLTAPAFAEAPPIAAPDDMTANEIIERAYDHAGGDEWVNPESLLMEGYSLFWRGSEGFVRYEPYRMWRVYPQSKDDAHAADGRVRIEAFSQGETVFQIAFDGERTYDQNGPVEEEADSDRWSSNFGFGVIRHALDEGYSLRRGPDDYVDGAPAYTVHVIDPAGGETLFNIRAEDFAVVRVGFDTPRGWHERIYSEFYRNEDRGWLQPGRVRLYYDGAKANEIYWTSFSTGEAFPVEMFRIGE
jgi:hypothetical protein